jgi:hypothetical protein
MEIQLYTKEAAQTKAGKVLTLLALSKLRLFKSALGTPTVNTTKAQLVAQECDFDGYTGGGYTLTAWTGPGFNGDGGSVITSPITMVAYGPAADPPVTNTIGGWWIELAAGAVWLVGTFDPLKNMGVVGDAFPLVVQIVEAKNSPIPG